MATNFVSPGNTIPCVAPAGGVSSSDGVVIGSMFVVALTDADEGEQFEGATTGVWEMPKAAAASGKDFDAGERVFFNTSAGNVDKTATGRFMVGVAVADAASTDTAVMVRLDGVSVAAA